MKKYIFVLIACISFSLAWCSMQSDTTEVVGKKRYKPTHPLSDGMWGDSSWRLYGEFSRYSSQELWVSFEYISDASVKSTIDSETVIVRSGNTLSTKDQFGSRILMLVFSGANIWWDTGTLEKHFRLAEYPLCRLTATSPITKQEWTKANNNFTYYELLFSWTDFPQDGSSFCPYQNRSSIVPLLITDKKIPNKIVMTFLCEGCGPDPDLSWIETLQIVK